MAGTNRKAKAKDKPTPGPVIILVEPQMAENVGHVARAMMNCGFAELRIVKPRFDWPSRKAVAVSSGADVILEKAKIFKTTEAAVKDLKRIYATTARWRNMSKPVMTSIDTVKEILKLKIKPQQVGLLFGKESKGLDNDDVAMCDGIISIPLNPTYSSLNLGQAVLLVAYEWLRATYIHPPRQLHLRDSGFASKDELLNFYGRLEEKLDACGFLRVKEKRPRMVRHIRNIFQKAELTTQEVNTLHGIITNINIKGAKGKR